MTKKLIPLILIITLIFSCVSNKKVLYLQEKTDLYGPAPKDSVLRTHEILKYDYKLQHEDVLSIQISSLTPEEYDFFSQGLPQQSQMNMTSRSSGSLHGYMVDKEGNIEFPVVGKIHVAGLNIYEVEEKIQKIAKEYLEEPVVNVRLLNFRFTVLGEVGGGGTVTTYNNRISLIEGIGLAGDLGELADRKNIKIIRQEENEAKVFYVDLLEEDFIESPYYYIHPNDIIIVPPLRQRPFRKYFGQNISLIVSTLSLSLLIWSLVSSK